VNIAKCCSADLRRTGLSGCRHRVRRFHAEDRPCSGLPAAAELLRTGGSGASSAHDARRTASLLQASRAAERRAGARPGSAGERADIRADGRHAGGAEQRTRGAAVSRCRRRMVDPGDRLVLQPRRGQRLRRRAACAPACFVGGVKPGQPCFFRLPSLLRGRRAHGKVRGGLPPSAVAGQLRAECARGASRNSDQELLAPWPGPPQAPRSAYDHAAAAAAAEGPAVSAAGRRAGHAAAAQRQDAARDRAAGELLRRGHRPAHGRAELCLPAAHRQRRGDIQRERRRLGRRQRAAQRADPARHAPGSMTCTV